MAPGAVQGDAGEDEDHGRDRDEVGDVLLRPEPGTVVVRCWREVHDQVDRDAHDRQRDTGVHQARHARHVGSDGAGGLYQ